MPNGNTRSAVIGGGGHVTLANGSPWDETSAHKLNRRGRWSSRSRSGLDELPPVSIVKPIPIGHIFCAKSSQRVGATCRFRRVLGLTAAHSTSIRQPTVALTRSFRRSSAKLFRPLETSRPIKRKSTGQLNFVSKMTWNVNHRRSTVALTCALNARLGRMVT